MELTKPCTQPGVSVAALLMLLLPAVASASDFSVYSPYVNLGRSELEAQAYGFQDGAAANNGVRAYDFSVAYGVTRWWKPELYFAQYAKSPGDHTQLIGNEFENTFQLAAMGEYWADPGFLLSYEHARGAGIPDVIEFGPLLAKQTNRFQQRLNLIWEKQIGGGAGGKFEFRSAYALNYRYTSALAPGMEVFYRPGDKSTQSGPVLSGELYTVSGGEVEYDLGVIFGINSQAPDTTWVLRLEYEF